QTTGRWREQFGRMLIEAFACGVPVIGSSSGEIPHVLADAGLIVDEHDDAGWATTLDRLLRDPAVRERLAQRGRRRAETAFAWPVIAREYVQFFDELRARRPAS
ncbi:MAG: glycosyltransferase, partial [Vulcanimicrobiaceae bacterium]